ncbi:MAG: MerR family transcriptional regulator [Agriterribacter sp.]
MYKQLDLFAAAATEPEITEPKEKAEPAAAEMLAETTVQVDEVLVPLPESVVVPELLFTPEATVAGEIHVMATAQTVKTPVARIAKKGKRGRKSLKEMEEEASFIEVPPDEILFKKQYYGIGEVAEMFGLNTSLLRYWETEFDILKPRKNRKGDRHFRPEDIKNLTLIHHLLRQRKYTIEGAKEYLKKNKSKAQENFEMIQRLEKIKSFLLELKAGL